MELRLQINYVPGPKVWRWRVANLEGREDFIIDVNHPTFLRMVYYVESVYAKIPTMKELPQLSVVHQPNGSFSWDIRRVEGEVLEGQNRPGNAVFEVGSSIGFVVSPIHMKSVMEYLRKLSEYQPRE
jgi:hypothetical protein